MKPHRFHNVDQFVRDITDPTNPNNRLNRPAKRTCRWCGGIYRSDVSVLCDDGVCSEECRAAELALLQSLGPN